MLKSNKTKKRIIENSTILFYENGYTSTSTKSIAKKSNISEATIFKYFKTKKNLLIETILFFLERFGNDIIVKPLDKIIYENENTSFEIILKKIILNRIELFDKYSKEFTIILNESQYHTEIKRIYKEKIMPNIKNYINILFDIGVKKNVFDKNDNAIIIFRSFISSIFFYILNNNFFPQIDTNLSQEDEIDILIDNFLNGVKKDKWFYE